MIVGIGVDIVEVGRFKGYRVATDLDDNLLGVDEILEYAKVGNKTAFLAKRFAAKEACIKATGIVVPLSDIQILHHPSGAPFVQSRCFKDYRLSVSISDEQHYAVAFVVAEKE
jgi:holo-[acyl-carrier protein] synthase